MKTEQPFALARELRARVDDEGAPAVRSLYRAFDRLNASYFGGRLPAVTILLSATGSPRALGDHCRQDEHGIHFRIRIAPAAFRRGEAYALDVLLHELVHVACAIADEPERGYRGHGPAFADRCNGIGALLELPAVAPRGRGAPDCAQWPVNVRPPGYYPPGALPASPRVRARARAENDVDAGVELDTELDTPRGAAAAARRELDAAQDGIARAIAALVSSDVAPTDEPTRNLLHFLRATAASLRSARAASCLELEAARVRGPSR